MSTATTGGRLNRLTPEQTDDLDALMPPPAWADDQDQPDPKKRNRTMDANGDIRHFKSEEYARRAGYTEPLTEHEAKQLEPIEQEKRRQALHRLRRTGKAQVVRIEDMTEPELAELMTTLARQVGMTCKAKGVETPLFAMLLFNDPSASQYIANCERQDMVQALRECADRLEQRQDVPR